MKTSIDAQWVAVLKSDQFVHRVVGMFNSATEADRWVDYNHPGEHWHTCILELANQIGAK